MPVKNKLKEINHIVKMLTLKKDHNLSLYAERANQYIINSNEDQWLNDTFMNDVNLFYHVYLFELMEHLSNINDYHILLRIQNFNNEVAADIRNDFRLAYFRGETFSTEENFGNFNLRDKYVNNITLVRSKIDRLKKKGIDVKSIETDFNEFINNAKQDDERIFFSIHLLNVMNSQISTYESQISIQDQALTFGDNQNHEQDNLSANSCCSFLCHLISISLVNLFNYVFTNREDGRIVIEGDNRCLERNYTYENSFTGVGFIDYHGSH